MKNFKYLKIVFAFFLVFVLVGSAKADLASTKILYLGRIDNKQAAVQAKIERISDLSYINATAQTQLINNFNSYDTIYLGSLKTQINACSTEDEANDFINSDWQLPYMVLIKSMFNYGNANNSASRIQTAYQLINDTKTFVANYATDPKYSLSKDNKQIALKWNFIKGAYAATTGWTCRQYDKTDSKVCEAQLNLQKKPCFWFGEFTKCVGDAEAGVDFAKTDGNGKDCLFWCDKAGLKDCYQNDKCAANQLFEEYTAPPTTVWTCRQYDRTDSKACEAQLNLQKEPCFWLDVEGFCLGNGKEAVELAQLDKDEKACLALCSGMKLEKCYAGAKCAANGLLEEYTALSTPVNGACGTANKHVYVYTDIDWGGYTQCSVGGSSGPSFPAAGATANWTCSAVNGGVDASCSASRSACGNGTTEGEEECDDGNIIDGSAGDFCYNNCTKRYLDAGDTVDLDNALAALDDYKSGVTNSLDSNVSTMDTLLTNIYNVYNQDITESEKIFLIDGYKESLESVYSSTQSSNNGIVTAVANILSL